MASQASQRLEVTGTQQVRSLDRAENDSDSQQLEPCGRHAAGVRWSDRVQARSRAGSGGAGPDSDPGSLSLVLTALSSGNQQAVDK